MNISIFGCQRNTFPEFCEKAEKLSYYLAKNGHTIVTGGSSGIMNSSNKGAFFYNEKQSCGIMLQNEKRGEYILEKNLFVAN